MVEIEDVAGVVPSGLEGEDIVDEGFDFEVEILMASAGGFAAKDFEFVEAFVHAFAADGEDQGLSGLGGGDFGGVEAAVLVEEFGGELFDRFGIFGEFGHELPVLFPGMGEETGVEDAGFGVGEVFFPDVLSDEIDAGGMMDHEEEEFPFLGGKGFARWGGVDVAGGGGSGGGPADFVEEVVTEGLFVEPEVLGGPAEKLILIDGGGGEGNGFEGGGGGAKEVGVAGGLGVGEHGMNEEVEGGLGLVEVRSEGGGAGAAEEGVGVVALGEGGNVYGESGRDEGVHGAEGGFLSGGVAIEDEGDGVGAAFEDAGMILGNSGSLGGDGVGIASEMAANDVDLAFAKEGILAFEDGLFGEPEAVDEAAFAEDGGFRAVDVFGLAIVAGE